MRNKEMQKLLHTKTQETQRQEVDSYLLLAHLRIYNAGSFASFMSYEAHFLEQTGTAWKGRAGPGTPRGPIYMAVFAAHSPSLIECMPVWTTVIPFRTYGDS